MVRRRRKERTRASQRSPARADSRRGGRRLTMLDLVFLVLAMAAGFSWARYDRYFQNDPQHRWNVTEVEPTQWLELGCCLGLTLSIAVVACRLRRPRPRWRRLRRQAGFVACLAVLLGVIYSSAGNLVFFNTGEGWEDRLLNVLAMLVIPPEAGGVAVGMWLAAWWSGILRAERSWLDRLGRVIGVFWACSGCAYTYLLSG